MSVRVMPDIDVFTNRPTTEFAGKAAILFCWVHEIKGLIHCRCICQVSTGEVSAWPSAQHNHSQTAIVMFTGRSMIFEEKNDTNSRKN